MNLEFKIVGWGSYLSHSLTSIKPVSPIDIFSRWDKGIRGISNLIWYCIKFVFLVASIFVLNTLCLLLIFPIFIIVREFEFVRNHLRRKRLSDKLQSVEKMYASNSRKIKESNVILVMLDDILKVHFIGGYKYLVSGAYLFVLYSRSCIRRYKKRLLKNQKSMLKDFPRHEPAIPSWKTRTPEEVFSTRSGVYEFIS